MCVLLLVVLPSGLVSMLASIGCSMLMLVLPRLSGPTMARTMVSTRRTWRGMA